MQNYIGKISLIYTKWNMNIFTIVRMMGY